MLKLVLPLQKEEYQKILREGEFWEVWADFYLEFEKKEKIKGERHRVVSLHAPLSSGMDISSSNARERKLTLIKLRVFLEDFANGEYILVLHPGGKLKKGEKEGEREKYMFKSIEELLKWSEIYRFRIALENLPPGYVGDNEKILGKILQTFPHPRLGLCIDTGHAHLTGNLKELLANFKERIFILHVHDNNGWSDQHFPPPYGVIPWDEILPLIPRDVPLVVEALPWGKSSISRMLEEVQALFTGKIVQSEGVFLKCKKCGHFLIEKGDNWSCLCGVGEKGDIQ
ncbi:MAG TPA: sugar phosphate isomerase/epimerase [bacterium]|nr:sugar phosphate isomerase/epimerase [bacterium]HEX67478.1 sugar phosphate isomerase/epimerase [bacterium]